jgi:peptide/nickel transport system permease protein
LSLSRAALRDALAPCLGASAELTFAGLLLAILIAVPFGIAAAVREGSWIDHGCRVLATAGVSLPVFFSGLLFLYVFYYRRG